MLHFFQLRKNDFWDYSMSLEYCNRYQKQNVDVTHCERCKKSIPNTCYQSHTLRCKRFHKCEHCNKNIYGQSPKLLSKAITNHLCHTHKCPLCFKQIFHNEYKSHSCLLKTSQHQTVFNRKCYFNIETCYDPKTIDSFKPILVVLEL